MCEVNVFNLVYCIDRREALGKEGRTVRWKISQLGRHGDSRGRDGVVRAEGGM
jgi:hypothetical protein